MSALIHAYQLDLLGGDPKPCQAWRPRFWYLSLMGCTLGATTEAQRQIDMLTQETGRAAQSKQGAQ